MAHKKIYPSLRAQKRWRGQLESLYPPAVAAFIVLAFVLYHVLWLKLPWTVSEILIVDKTVPEAGKYSEHSALVWIFEHFRTGPKRGSPLSPEDFLGYHPATKKCEDISSRDISRYDLIYLADTYGTYEYKMSFKEYERNLPKKNLDVSLICGGLSRNEVSLLTGGTKQGAKVIGEFNIFGYPTYLDPEALTSLEKFFGVTWTGWFGRHYDSLSSPPKWVKDLYEAVNGESWNFSGPGTVMVKKSEMVGIEPDVMVFKDPRDYARPFAIYAKKHPLTEGVDSPLVYDGWFEIVRPEKGTEVLAYYHLAETPSHLSQLRARGLKPIFPAIVLKTGRVRTLYFAGDFADDKFFQVPPDLFGTETFMKVLSRVNRTDSFQWRFYAPLMRNVIYW